MQISYPYIDGTHSPRKFQQFHGVVTVLHKLHEAGYVHRDIKKENIIFNDDKDISYLIDFDLAKKEGGKYTEGFRFFEGVS